MDDEVGCLIDGSSIALETLFVRNFPVRPRAEVVVLNLAELLAILSLDTDLSDSDVLIGGIFT